MHGYDLLDAQSGHSLHLYYTVSITKPLQFILFHTVVCLPFVTMFTILKAEAAGLLLAPGFCAHTDTVPALYCGSPVRTVMVMGCSTNVEILNSMPVMVA